MATVFQILGAEWLVFALGIWLIGIVALVFGALWMYREAQSRRMDATVWVVLVVVATLLADHRGAAPIAEGVRGPGPVARVPDVPHGLLPVDEAGVHRVPQELTSRFLSMDHERQVHLGAPAKPIQGKGHAVLRRAVPPEEPQAVLADAFLHGPHRARRKGDRRLPREIAMEVFPFPRRLMHMVSRIP